MATSVTPPPAPGNQWVNKKDLIVAFEELIRKYGDRIPRSEVAAVIRAFLYCPAFVRVVTAPRVQELKFLIEQSRNEMLY